MKYSLIYDVINNEISEKTILICATMEHIITNKNLYVCLKKWHNKYNKLDYGLNFKEFLKTKTPYNSYGILGAIRTIPYIYLDLDLDTIIEKALINSNTTHLNEKSDNGVIALMKILYMIKHNKSKEDIYKELSKHYDLKFHIKDINKYKKEPSTENIIPYCIVLYLENNNINDCLNGIKFLKHNTKSLSIICGTMFYLKNKTYDNSLYLNYLKYMPEEINELVLKFENF